VHLIVIDTCIFRSHLAPLISRFACLLACPPARPHDLFHHALLYYEMGPVHLVSGDPGKASRHSIRYQHQVCPHSIMWGMGSSRSLFRSGTRFQIFNLKRVLCLSFGIHIRSERNRVQQKQNQKMAVCPTY
jgi:hypothetical protein